MAVSIQKSEKYFLEKGLDYPEGFLLGWSILENQYPFSKWIQKGWRNLSNTQELEAKRALEKLKRL